VTTSAADVLVDTAWVAQHLEDPNVRLVEVDVDTTAYDSGHIPGAVGWNWRTQLSDTVRRDVTSRQTLERLLSASGIGNDTIVILYGDHNNWFAAWAFWQLKLFGHRDARLMDGGRVKWQAEGRPMITERPDYPATDYRAAEPDYATRAFRDRVIDSLGQAGVALVDVRSPKEYSGELLAPENLPQEGAQRGGHIPGAVNVPWSEAVQADGTFKPIPALRELYAGQGVTPDKEVITYCRIGERSAHTWFVLKYLLGYDDVRNYDGSWSEYGSLVDVPIERTAE